MRMALLEPHGDPPVYAGKACPRADGRIIGGSNKKRSSTKSVDDRFALWRPSRIPRSAPVKSSNQLVDGLSLLVADGVGDVDGPASGTQVGLGVVDAQGLVDGGEEVPDGD